MATYPLKSSDFVKNRFSKPIKSHQPSNSRPNPNPNPNPNHARNCSSNSNSCHRPRRKNCNTEILPGDRVKIAARRLVMGQVTILKRGEKLDQSRIIEGRITCDGSPPINVEREGTDLGLLSSVNLEPERIDYGICSTDRFGPDPEIVQEQIRAHEFKLADDRFSGTTHIQSPPPSLLPFPDFCRSNKKTSDLKRSPHP